MRRLSSEKATRKRLTGNSMIIASIWDLVLVVVASTTFASWFCLSCLVSYSKSGFQLKANLTFYRSSNNKSERLLLVMLPDLNLLFSDTILAFSSRAIATTSVYRWDFLASYNLQLTQGKVRQGSDADHECSCNVRCNIHLKRCLFWRTNFQHLNSQSVKQSVKARMKQARFKLNVMNDRWMNEDCCFDQLIKEGTIFSVPI